MNADKRKLWGEPLRGDTREKTLLPFNDNSFPAVVSRVILTVPVKRRRAMLASNPIKE
jgi:hypothetical protein